MQLDSLVLTYVSFKGKSEKQKDQRIKNRNRWERKKSGQEAPISCILF